jgi:S-methylmethionine-dependent homocysteine/selenocysteine methylase
MGASPGGASSGRADVAGFPAQRQGVLYLTEGGQETELMYKYGHDLPEFALFPMLDSPAAVADLQEMYRRYLQVAAAHRMVPLMGGLDYRASPDWAQKLGISPEGLREYQLRCIDFLREAARPFREQLPDPLFVGIVGPRGDAYGQDRFMTAEEAEDYHSVQLSTLREAHVDLVGAMTFNGVPEAVGLARAAARAGLPLTISWMVDKTGRVREDLTLQAAVETVDDLAGESRPDFYGINCSHPEEFASALTPGPWLARVRSLRPNASKADKLSLCQIGHLEAGNPQELGQQMADLSERLPHVDIWGGCCGTWDEHLEATAQSLLHQAE